MKLFIIVCLLVTAVTGGIWAYRDGPVVDDRDLRKPRSEISAARNGFTILQQAGEALAISEQDLSIVEKSWEPEDKWNFAEINPVLARNEVALGLFLNASVRSEFQVPEIASMGELQPYLGNWQKLRRLALGAALARHATGDSAQALDMTIATLRIGHRLQDSGGGIVNWLVQGGIKNQALLAAFRILRDAKFEAAQLEEFAAEVKGLGDNRIGFERVCYAEYRLILGSVDAVLKGQLIIDDEEPHKYSGGRLKVAPGLYKPNITTTLIAEYCRQLLATLDRDSYEPVRQDYPTFREAILDGNTLGNLIFRECAVGVSGVDRRRRRTSAQVSILQVSLAMLSYAEQHDQYPETLFAMVPKFLHEVPQDPFDGQSLKLSHRTVYSVGPNRVDDGGNVQALLSSQGDLGFDLPERP
ncbi:MAG: hypothetical protein ACI8W8_004916 [Rhodothermales bacterium]|jgi:hypothetical protein